jgi:hypothetical protein
MFDGDPIGKGAMPPPPPPNGGWGREEEVSEREKLVEGW